jgi:hypothetical protein
VVSLAAAAFFAFSTPAGAVETRALRDDTFSDFNKGVSTGTVLLAEGRVQAGPRAVAMQKSSEGIVWDIATSAPDGAIYYSTGHSGKVFRIMPDGKQELWADLSEVEATALAVNSKGVLYVGASPGGKIYEVKAKGKPVLSWETGEKYVWDLAIDGKDVLYAATGTAGKIFRISYSGGRAALYFDSDATNVMDLDFDAEGNLLAATQGKAYLIRISEENKGYVLYAASQDELRSITVGADGNIYAAANSSRISSVFDKSSTSTSSASSEFGSKLGGQGVVVQVHPNGFVNGLWAAPEGPIHALLADGGTSEILAAAGKNGKLYSVNAGDATYSVLADIDEPMITALARGKDGVLMGSANKAAVYKLQPLQPQQAGQFASRALDADSTVRWGNIMFEGEITGAAKITWETRSGNTPEPSDGTWSPWTSATAVGDRIVKVASPIAQYLQYRITIQDAHAPGQSASFIDGVRVFYVEKNVPPVIKKVDVEKVPGSPAAAQAAALAAAAARIQQSASSKSDDSDSKAKEASEEAAKAATAAARAAQAAATAKAAAEVQNSQKLNISWTAADPNQDKLRYNLYYKGEDEKVWKLIEDNITEAKHQFSTEAIPDGQYRFKLEATDRFENPQTSASTVQAVSRIYTVDNSAPEITDIKARRISANDYEITAKATDKTSIISAAEYNLNAADEWISLAPTDAIFDFQTEEFRFHVTPEKPQPEHTLSIRAYDQEGNSRVEKILLQ